MKRLLLHVTRNEKILALLEDEILSDIVVEKNEERDLVGRIYKGIVRNVVPALNGMFVDIGIGQNAFLRVKGEYHSEGSSVLVQVEKDSTETKGPLVTEEISIPGKYAVALLDSDYIGISRKIRDEESRARLRNIARKVCPPQMGVVVRTAASEIDSESFEKDLMMLRSNAEIIFRRFKLEKGPLLLYRDGDIVVKSIRDYFSYDVEELVVDEEDTYKRLLQVGKSESEEIGAKIKFYNEKMPLFTAYHVEEQIHSLFDKNVPLSNGGSLVIEYTEALTVIDVNSGSFQGKGIPHSELAFLVNKAAAYEIARQIRLRGIGGIIMIDFLDMDKKSQKEEILQILKSAVYQDKIKTVVCGMTSLGLVEMTRKRTKHRLWKNYYDACPLCHGKGVVKSPETISNEIVNELEKRRASGPFKTGIMIQCHQAVGNLLSKDPIKSYLEKLVNHQIVIEKGNDMDSERFEILSLLE